MSSFVSAVAAAPSPVAEAHFAAEFTFETDCWDVHDALSKIADFVLLDVRSPALFAKGHIKGAINLPHGKIVESRMNEWSKDTLFVTYCAGPHCNGAARGALRLAKLGRPVKIMAGGVTGWLDEGFTLESSDLREPSHPAGDHQKPYRLHARMGVILGFFRSGCRAGIQAVHALRVARQSLRWMPPPGPKT